MHIATRRNYEKTASVSLEYGISTDSQDRYDSLPSLHITAFANISSVTSLLIHVVGLRHACLNAIMVFVQVGSQTKLGGLPLFLEDGRVYKYERYNKTFSFERRYLSIYLNKELDRRGSPYQASYSHDSRRNCADIVRRLVSPYIPHTLKSIRFQLG